MVIILTSIFHFFITCAHFVVQVDIYVVDVLEWQSYIYIVLITYN